jgi:hypothetical protein
MVYAWIGLDWIGTCCVGWWIGLYIYLYTPGLGLGVGHGVSCDYLSLVVLIFALCVGKKNEDYSLVVCFIFFWVGWVGLAQAVRSSVL